jgi:hypothetical protein
MRPACKIQRKFEIRISKSETSTNLKIEMLETGRSGLLAWFLSFGIRICFGIRYSDFYAGREF